MPPDFNLMRIINMNLDAINRVLYYILPPIIIPYGLYYLAYEGDWVRTPIVLVGVIAWSNIHRKFTKSQQDKS